MIRQYVPVALLLFMVFIAISALHAQHYDDLYYNPQTDYAHFYGANAGDDKAQGNELSGRSGKANEQQPDAEDEGYFYSSRIRRFHRPARFHYYEMWSTPWGFNDPWYMGSGLGMFNNYYPGFGYHSWNSWNPYCFSSFNNPWSYHGWNSGYYNAWGMGGNVIVNNYYGNGWYGNGWSPYYPGWNNPYHNNYFPGTGGNWGGGKPSNPKGVVTGPRQTGGISTPTPPKRNQYKEAEIIKNGRNPRVDAQRAETMKSEKTETERNIRGRDSRENPVSKDRSNDNVPQAEPQKRQEPRRQQSLTPQSETPKRENETRNPSRNFDDKPRRKNMAEGSEYRYTPPARSNDYERSSRQPRYETRSEPRTYDSSPRSNSSPSRSSSGGGAGSSGGGGRRGRD